MDLQFTTHAVVTDSLIKLLCSRRKRPLARNASENKLLTCLQRDVAKRDICLRELQHDLIVLILPFLV